MARVVSLTLFLLSWLLLFSYAASYSTPPIECQVCIKVVDHIHQQVQNNSAKVEKVFDPTDVADSVFKIEPQIDKLANLVYYDLYPDACSVKPPSTKKYLLFCKLWDGITRPPLDPKTSNGALMVNKDSKQKTKVKKKLPINKQVSKKIKKKGHKYKKKGPSVEHKHRKRGPSFWDRVVLEVVHMCDLRKKDDP
ncbi:uncharacterized protein LOC144545266 isoform X2 [Carex rostrata]